MDATGRRLCWKSFRRQKTETSEFTTADMEERFELLLALFVEGLEAHGGV